MKGATVAWRPVSELPAGRSNLSGCDFGWARVARVDGEGLPDSRVDAERADCCRRSLLNSARC